MIRGVSDMEGQGLEGPDQKQEPEIETYFAMARIHGDTAGADQRIADLEDLARVAWRLLTPAQKTLFHAEPETLAIADSFGDFADEQNADF